jgi:hypothetical protein
MTGPQYAAGQHHILHICNLQPHDLGQLKAKATKLIIYSAIRYLDVFETVHVSETCSVALFPADGGAKIILRAFNYHNGYWKEGKLGDSGQPSYSPPSA